MQNKNKSHKQRICFRVFAIYLQMLFIKKKKWEWENCRRSRETRQVTLVYYFFLLHLAFILFAVGEIIMKIKRSLCFFFSVYTVCTLLLLTCNEKYSFFRQWWWKTTIYELYIALLSHIYIYIVPLIFEQIHKNNAEINKITPIIIVKSLLETWKFSFIQRFQYLTWDTWFELIWIGLVWCGLNWLDFKDEKC